MVDVVVVGNHNPKMVTKAKLVEVVETGDKMVETLMNLEMVEEEQQQSQQHLVVADMHFMEL